VPAVTVKVPIPPYEVVPPVAATVMVEVPPLHKIGVDVDVAANWEGCVIVTEADAVHPLASVTV
jgi:hypothetical protein